MEQMTKDNGLSELFNQYKKSHESKKRLSREEIMKQYFTPRNSSETFRILPQHEGQRYFEEAYFHYLKVGNDWKKLYCPKHNDGDNCVLCQVADSLYKMQDKSIIGKKDEELNASQKEAKAKNNQIYEEYKKFAVVKFYITKGLDKGALKDGVKFWRFKHNKLKKGVLDKLMPVIEHFFKTSNKNFSDPQFGCDFSLTVSENRLSNGRPYKEISAILPDGPKPITDDANLLKTALEDRRVWRDVFKKSTPPLITYDEYLTLVAKSKGPYYDKKDPNNKKWVYPGNPELETKANSGAHRQETEDDVDEETTTTSETSNVNDYLNSMQSTPKEIAPAVPTSPPINVTNNTQSGAIFDPLQQALNDLPF